MTGHSAHRVRSRRALAFAGVFACVAAASALAPAANAAVTFTAIDPTDAPDANLNGQCASTHLGLCTLRAALQEAEHAGGG